MRTASIRVLAIACLASLGLGTSANAAFIFAFGQSDPTNTGVITATPNAGNTATTLTTNSTPNPGSIPILVSQEGNSSLPVSALETFVGVTTTGSASSGTTGVSQLISGLINFNVNNGPGNPAGPLILSIQFTNSVLEGAGNSGDLRGSQPGQGTVTLTVGPAGAPIAAAVGVPIGTPFTGAYSNSLVGVLPPFSIVGTTIAGFTAQTAGNVSPSTIPEPASIVMTSTAVLAGFGVFGWRRRKVAKA